MDPGDSGGLAVEPNRGSGIASNVTRMPRETTMNEKGDTIRVEEVGHNTRRTHVESTQINEAIAMGVAANVDDFMVCLRYLTDVER